MPKESISATEIKNRFGDYLGTVLKQHEPLLIERHGKPAAVLVDYEKWQAMTEDCLSEKDVPWVHSLEKVIQEIERSRCQQKRKGKKFSAVDLIKKARQEGY